MNDPNRPTDQSRQMSYGVTPQALKTENAHDWSDSVIHNIENVSVETPRNEQPPSLTQSSSTSTSGYSSTPYSGGSDYDRYTSKSSTSGTMGTISENVSQKAAEVKDAAGSMYNSAANTVSNMTQGSQNTNPVFGSDPAVRRTSAGPPVYKSSGPTSPSTTGSISSSVASGVNAASNTVASGVNAASNTLGNAYNSAANTISQATTSTPSYASHETQSTPSYRTNETSPTSTVPDRVLRSDAIAGVPLEAAGEPAAVEQKSAFEDELLSTVKPTPAINDTTGGVLSSTQGALATARDTAGSAATSLSNTASSAATNLSNTAGAAVSSLTSAFQNTSLTGSSPSVIDNSQSTTSVVPDVVKESQIQAHQSPEASADPSAVRHKQLFEDELLGDVRQTPAISSTRTTTTDVANKVGDVAAQAGNTAYNLAGQATQQAKAVATSDTVQQGAAQVQSALGSFASGAMGMASALVTQAGQSIQSMTAAPSTEPTTQRTTTSDLTEHSRATTGVTPAVAMESQEIIDADPEASGFRSAVEHKQVMEDELLAKVDAAPPVATSSSNPLTSAHSDVTSASNPFTSDNSAPTTSSDPFKLPKTDGTTSFNPLTSDNTGAISSSNPFTSSNTTATSASNPFTSDKTTTTSSSNPFTSAGTDATTSFNPVASDNTIASNTTSTGALDTASTTGSKRPHAQPMDTQATIDVVKNMPGSIW